jgi:hypothetical protein
MGGRREGEKGSFTGNVLRVFPALMLRILIGLVSDFAHPIGIAVAVYPYQSQGRTFCE